MSRRTIRSSRAKCVSLLAAGALAVTLNVASGTAAFADGGPFGGLGRTHFGGHARHHFGLEGREHHRHHRFVDRRDFDDCFCEDEFELFRFDGRRHHRDHFGFERTELRDDAIANLHMGDNDHHVGLGF